MSKTYLMSNIIPQLPLKHKGKIIGSCFFSTLTTMNEDFKRELWNHTSYAKSILI